MRSTSGHSTAAIRKPPIASMRRPAGLWVWTCPTRTGSALPRGFVLQLHHQLRRVHEVLRGDPEARVGDVFPRRSSPSTAPGKGAVDSDALDVDIRRDVEPEVQNVATPWAVAIAPVPTDRTVGIQHRPPRCRRHRSLGRSGPWPTRSSRMDRRPSPWRGPAKVSGSVGSISRGKSPE